MTGLRIVVVEDNAQIRALLAEVLVALGHEVCAITATETGAVAAASLHEPSLMIVDAHLQEGNGVSAMATILASTTMPHVFITGGALRNFPNGATVLLKPFSKQSLVAALNRVAGHGRS